MLERQEDDEFLGFCGLDLLTRDVAPNLAGEVEIGWRLREDAWGRDYATESASVVLDLAFCIRRIERVVSRADVANQASINVMQKLGMRQWHARETDVEEVVYVIQRSDWVGSRSRKGGVLEHASD